MTPEELMLEQLVRQTEIEFVLLCFGMMVVGIYLFSWGVKLWKRYSR